MKKAIILCSGGLDSTVCAYYVKKKLNFDKVELLFFDYGQKSLESERKAIQRCANDLKTIFHTVNIRDLKKLIVSGLTSNIKVKSLKRKDLKNTKKESSKFYVPFRNTIFASYAIAYAETIAKTSKVSIFFGFKSEGSESYSDTTKSYVLELNNLLKKMKIKNIKIEAPLIDMDKEDIIILGDKLDVNLGKTFSCYISSGQHCGKCLACALRKEGFYWSNIEDKTRYLN